MKNIIKARVELLLSMSIFGSIGLVRKYIPLSSASVAFARGIIGMLFILLVILIKGKGLSKAAIRRNSGLLICSGILLGFNWIALFEAYRYTSVAVATTCYYMAPVFVILLSPIIFNEKLTAKKVVCSAVALVGIILVSGLLNDGIYGFKGVIFGLSAALMYAGIVILNKKLHGLSGLERSFVQLGISAVAILPYILATEGIPRPDLDAHIITLIVIAGIVHTGLAYTLYFGSMERLSAQTVALYSYIDPIVAILLSAFVLRESIDYLSGIGIVLVIAATLLCDIKFSMLLKKKGDKI